MAALDIMVGDEKRKFEPVRQRDPFCLCQNGGRGLALQGDGGRHHRSLPYPDVPYTNWAAPYVEAAVSAGYVNGYLDGTFRPNNNINLAEGVTIVLRLLGYQDSDFSGVYPSGQMAKYHSLGLDKGSLPPATLPR